MNVHRRREAKRARRRRRLASRPGCGKVARAVRRVDLMMEGEDRLLRMSTVIGSYLKKRGVRIERKGVAG